MLFQERHRAESFGAVAELYDRVRPSYPSALVDALLLERPRRVLDIGCGTGIAGALLDARGCEVLGVEIDERMARLARARGLQVEIAPFEQWDAEGRLFELAISAQAWHWIDPVAGAEKAATVLAEAGRICLFWNFGDPPARVTELFDPIYARHAPGVESYSVLLGNYDARAESTVAGTRRLRMLHARGGEHVPLEPPARAQPAGSSSCRPTATIRRSRRRSASGCWRRSAKRSTRSADRSRWPTRPCS